MFQRIQVIGNLGADPRKFTYSGDKLACEMRIAVNEGSKDDRKTTWYKAVVFNGQTAEACLKYLTKGRMVFVEGRPSINTYEKKDGSGTESVISINVDKIDFLSSDKREDGDGQRDERPQTGNSRPSGNSNNYGSNRSGNGNGNSGSGYRSSGSSSRSNSSTAVEDDDVPF